MSGQLIHSMFHDVYFPEQKKEVVKSLFLQKTLRFIPDTQQEIAQTPWAVFDFETTGLSAEVNEIIEIGAIRYDAGNCTSYSTLIKPKAGLPPGITKITGITEEMLVSKPPLCDVLGEFLRFIKGAILIAHNAEFDASFLRAACARHNYKIEYPVYCTLKMARQLLPDLERRTLDALATHYDLSFSARHRSVGDAEVTATVFKKMLQENSLHSLAQLHSFIVN